MAYNTNQSRQAVIDRRRAMSRGSIVPVQHARRQQAVQGNFNYRPPAPSGSMIGGVSYVKNPALNQQNSFPAPLTPPSTGISNQNFGFTLGPSAGGNSSGTKPNFTDQFSQGIIGSGRTSSQQSNFIDQFRDSIINSPGGTTTPGGGLPGQFGGGRTPQFGGGRMPQAIPKPYADWRPPEGDRGDWVMGPNGPVRLPAGGYTMDLRAGDWDSSSNSFVPGESTRIPSGGRTPLPPGAIAGPGGYWGPEQGSSRPWVPQPVLRRTPDTPLPPGTIGSLPPTDQYGNPEGTAYIGSGPDGTGWGPYKPRPGGGYWIPPRQPGQGDVPGGGGIYYEGATTPEEGRRRYEKANQGNRIVYTNPGGVDQFNYGGAPGGGGGGFGIALPGPIQPPGPSPPGAAAFDASGWLDANGQRIDIAAGGLPMEPQPPKSWFSGSGGPIPVGYSGGPIQQKEPVIIDYPAYQRNSATLAETSGDPNYQGLFNDILGGGGSGDGAVMVGGDIGVGGGIQPGITEQQVFSPGDIQRLLTGQLEVNAMEQGSRDLASQNRMGAAGFQRSSGALAGNERMNAFLRSIADATANREIPLMASAQNAQQLLATQSAREGQFANRQQEDIGRRRIEAGLVSPLLTALGSLF